MKCTPTLLLLFFLATNSFAQGTIQSITVSPENPTINDDVSIYVDVQFNSGDCAVDDQGLGLNGTDIAAYAHHCTGALTVICNTTDTFELGQLAAGAYTFDFTLTSGFGGPGCSPGFIPDDDDQLQFVVSTNVGIDELAISEDFVFPNPVEDVLNLRKSLSVPLTITNISGQTILKVPIGETRLDVSGLKPGLYFLKSDFGKTRFIKR